MALRSLNVRRPDFFDLGLGRLFRRRSDIPDLADHSFRTAFTAIMNIIESGFNVSFLALAARHSPVAVLVGAIGTAMTASKTILYWLCDYVSAVVGFSYFILICTYVCRMVVDS